MNSSVCGSPSKISNCALVHLWPTVNLSLQLKHNPYVRQRCISSQDSRLKGTVGDARLGTGGVWLTIVGQNNLRWRVIWSSFIRARLMASFNVRGLNIRISSAISVFNPPVKVPTNAFCDHP